MKNYYRTESSFYFLLLLIYQDIFTDKKRSKEATEEMTGSIQTVNKKYELDANFQETVSQKRIESLLNCVGSIIFIKHKKYYYARTCELFKFLISYKSVTSSSQIDSEYLINLIQSNFKKFNRDSKDILNFKQLISNNYFSAIKVKSEIKKISFYVLKHKNLKRKTHHD